MRRDVLLFIGVSVASFIFDPADGHRRLRTKVRNLEEQVSLLTKDVDELKKYVETFHNGKCCCEGGIGNNTGQVGNDTVTKINKTNIDHWEVNNIFELFKIYRIYHKWVSVNYTVKYTVDYSLNPTNFFSYWNIYTPESSYQKLMGFDFKPRPSEPITRASTITNQKPESEVIFVFGAEGVWYSLRLVNWLYTNATLTNISLPEIHVRPEEVVYPIGENASFQILTSPYIELPDYFSISDQMLFNVKTHEYKEVSSESSIEYDNRTLPGMPGRVTNVTLDMRVPLSGVITFKATRVFNESKIRDVITEVSMYKWVVIRPSNQSGPFDEDLFTFYTQGMQKDSNGNWKQSCISGVKCSVQCIVVGSNITEMKVSIPRQGNRTRTRTVILTSLYYITQFHKELELNTKGTFECQATKIVNEKRIKTISQKISIIVAVPAKVVSGTVQLKGKVPYRKTLRVRCVGQGVSLPKMIIQVMCATDSLTFSGRELDVISRSGETIVVSKDVMVPYTYFGQKIDIICTAHNEEGSHDKVLKSIVINYPT